MTLSIALALLVACDGGRPELNLEAIAANDEVCATTPTIETICADRATDLPIASAGEAVLALTHTLPIAELGLFDLMVQDIAEEILDEQNRGLREPCLTRTESAQSGVVTYEGSCAQADGEALWFEGTATFTSGEASTGAVYSALSTGETGGESYEANGRYSAATGSAVAFSADLRVRYDMGWEAPIAWTLVTEATGEGMTWHQIAWLQVESDPEATALGAICFAADWDASETCADEADGALTVVGADRWDLVSAGSEACDSCYEVSRDCEPAEPLCDDAAR